MSPSSADFGVAPVGLVVFERTGRWAAAWRRALPQSGMAQRVRLAQVRSTAECREEVARDPQALLAVELTADGRERALELIDQIHRSYPGAVIVALAARQLADYELLVREMGVQAWVTTTRRIAELLPLIRRHARRSERRTSPQSVTETIWANLPWGD